MGNKSTYSNSTSGPYGVPVLGNFFDLRSDPLGFVSRVSNEYGPIATIRLGPASGFLINSPEMIAEVLVKKSDVFGFPPSYRKMIPVIGKGLTATPIGRDWKRQRRMLQPFFTKESVGAYQSQFVDSVAGWCSGLKESGETRLDIYSEMSSIALGSLYKSLFSQQFDGSVATESVLTVSEVTAKRFWALTPLAEFMPSTDNKKFRQAMDALDGVVYGLIENRRMTTDRPKDFLTGLIKTYDPDSGQYLTDTEIRDQLVTFLLAGHETTACLLSWAFILLAQNPEIRKAFLEEVDGIDSDRLREPDLLDALPFTLMILKESMRLYPPVWMMQRQAKEDAEIAGVKVKKDSIIYISAYALHRNREIWDHPELFDPKRFSPSASKRHPLSWIPFGAGPKTCIGNHFALLEGVVTLAAIAKDFKLELATDQTVAMKPIFALHPSTTSGKSLDMLVHRR